jgi:hypothetical protein
MGEGAPRAEATQTRFQLREWGIVDGKEVEGV